MENITAATSPSTDRHVGTVVVSAAQRAGELLLQGIKALGFGMFDPMSCSAYWVVPSPYTWSNKK